MDLLILKFFVFLRPIMFMESGAHVFGLNLFEAAAIFFSLVLVTALVMRAAVWKTVSLTGVDILIIAFSIWCIVAFIVYYEVSDLRELGKFVLPFLTYVIARNIITQRSQYKELLFWMIVGFVIPLLVTTGMTIAGKGVEWVNYWTGVPRYQGLYSGPHNMAHNMTFLLMLCVAYAVLSINSEKKLELSLARKWFLAVSCLLALYCLYYSGVRTTIGGLAVFAVVLAYFVNRRLLIIGAVVAVVIGAIFSLQLKQHFFYEEAMFERTGKSDTEDLASGRPRIWLENISEFVQLPIDRQLAGVGIGNSADKPGSDLAKIVDSHNDFLEVVMQTGIIGFVLFMAIQVALFRAIWRLEGKEKYLFLAIFLAVAFMNFVSNSYVSRFGLAQMYYFLIVYAELFPPVSRAQPVPAFGYPSRIQ